MIKLIIKIAIAILLFGFLWRSELVDFTLLTKFADHTAWLVAIFGCILLNYLLSTWRWYRLNQTHAHGLSFFSTFISIYIGLFFNNVLPGSISGDLARINYLYRHTNGSPIEGTLSVVVDRVIGLLGVFYLLDLVGFVSLNEIYVGHYLYLEWLIKVCFGISFILTSIIFSLIFLPDRLYQYVSLHHWPIMADLAKALRVYKRSPFTILECIFASMLTQLIIAVVIALVAYALGFHTLLFYHFTIASLVTQLVNLIPLSPGGLGVGEAAFAKTMILFSHKTLPFATILLSYRMFSLLSVMPAGLICLKDGIFFGKKEKLV